MGEAVLVHNWLPEPEHTKYAVQIHLEGRRRQLPVQIHLSLTAHGPRASATELRTAPFVHKSRRTPRAAAGARPCATATTALICSHIYGYDDLHLL